MQFTLDTNCLIDIEEGRAGSDAIRFLADAHQHGEAHVAVVAISASEKQKDGKFLQTFDQFQRRLGNLGLGHLEIIHPMFYFDVAFWDWAYLTDSAMETLEKAIHDILFPNIIFHWGDYCKAHDLDSRTATVPGRWLNAKCDVQAMWSHIHHGRDIFVTGDGNFHAASKQQALIQLGARQILHAGEAAGLVS